MVVHCGPKSHEDPITGRFCPCILLAVRCGALVWSELSLYSFCLCTVAQSRPRLPSLVGFVLAVVWVCMLCLKVVRGSLLWSVLSFRSFGFACFVSKSPEAPFSGRFALFLMVHCACGSKSHERVLVRDTRARDSFAALLFRYGYAWD